MVDIFNPPSEIMVKNTASEVRLKERNELWLKRALNTDIYNLSCDSVLVMLIYKSVINSSFYSNISIVTFLFNREEYINCILVFTQTLWRRLQVDCFLCLLSEVSWVRPCEGRGFQRNSVTYLSVDRCFILGQAGWVRLLFWSLWQWDLYNS